MSNYLGLATVTAALRLKLENALSADINDIQFTVTVGRPDEPNENNAGARVNLYLYQTTPNAAWRNADLPTRDPRGALLQRPRLALDLHYLLTFYGDESNLEPQRLLGSALRALHAGPTLTRAQIEAAVVSADYPFLATSNLGDEIESVKFSPIPLNLEELSKLWSVFFQTTYNLSVAYMASVVFIEGQETAGRALPVQTRTVVAPPTVAAAAVVTPDQLDGLALWLKSDVGVTYDNLGVSRWSDQSGLERDGVQDNAVSRPAFVAHGLGQRPVLRFDGVDDRLAIEDLNFSAAQNGVTIYAVARSTSNAAQVVISFDDEQYWELLLSQGDANAPRAQWRTADSTATLHTLPSTLRLSDTRWHVLAGWFEAGAAPDKQLLVDGVSNAQATAHGGNSLGAGATRFGFLGVGSQAAGFDGAVEADGFLAGEIAEIVLFTRALDATEREQLDVYFSQRYGLAP